MAKLPCMGMGRIGDLRARPDADRIGYTIRGLDACPTVYKSRAALKAFAKGSHHALIKDPVPRNMVINPNFQRGLDGAKRTSKRRRAPRRR